jgi:hypothetical protein
MPDGVTLVQGASKPWKAAYTHCGSRQHKAAKCPNMASAQMMQETGDEKVLERLAWYS